VIVKTICRRRINIGGGNIYQLAAESDPSLLVLVETLKLLSTGAVLPYLPAGKI
jgi:hypothetical protein